MMICPTLFNIIDSYHRYEKILNNHEKLRELIDTESFQTLVHDALGVSASEGKPVYWFEAVSTVNWEVMRRILEDDVSSDAELTEWKDMLQPLFHRCTQNEKDFLRLVIVHHSLLRLLKKKLVHFKHVPHCDLYNSKDGC